MPRRLSLAGQFLVFQLGVVLCVVAAVAAVSLAGADAAFRREQEPRLRSVAETVAATPAVRAGMENPVLRDALSAAAESARAVSGASYVLIADADGTLLTGPDAGHPAVLGDSDVLSGRAWGGVVDDGRRTLVAHVPVLDGNDARITGFAAVGVTYPTLPQLLATALPDLLTYLLLAGALGVAGSLLLARRIKRQTLGLEPSEITGLVEHREAMLHDIKEGVIGTDTADRVMLVNDEAVRLLGLPPETVGRSLRVLRLGPPLLDVLTGRVSGADRVVRRDGRVIVLNRMPVRVRGRAVGWVTTLRDRTELTALRRELDVSRHTTDTLRAQAHEFTNRLHTIAGLVELGEYDEVVRYVTRASQIQETLTRDVTSLIAEPSLAALLIAKASLAAEQGVTLRIASDSALDPVDDALSTDLVTVVGNLVDNALDATGTGGWVEVRVRTTADAVVVRVRDSGAGVAPELAQQVFREGFTTKADGDHRGLGLSLTRLICTGRGGAVEVAGSVFTARIPHRFDPAATTTGPAGATT